MPSDRLIFQTYTGDSVLALRKVRNKLSCKMKDLEKENIHLRSRLDQYEKCGPELTDIVGGLPHGDRA